MTCREQGKKTETQYILQTAFPGKAFHSYDITVLNSDNRIFKLLHRIASSWLNQERFDK